MNFNTTDPYTLKYLKELYLFMLDGSKKKPKVKTSLKYKGELSRGEIKN